jgi:hypothetical protein
MKRRVVLIMLVLVVVFVGGCAVIDVLGGVLFRVPGKPPSNPPPERAPQPDTLRTESPLPELPIIVQPPPKPSEPPGPRGPF